MTTPRSIKRKVIPIIPDEEEDDVPELLAPALSSQIIPNSETEEDAIIQPANLSVQEQEKVAEVVDEDEDDDEEEVLSPEEEERLRIWDIFSEEYHDSKFVCCLFVVFLCFLLSFVYQ